MTNNARTPAAERMELHRERCRRGLHCLMIERRETLSAHSSAEDYWSKKRVTIGTPFSRRFMVTFTERWGRHRDAQPATDRLTIKDLENDAFTIYELHRAGHLQQGN